MTIRNLCLDCSRDGNGCWDRRDDEPLVHCTTFVSKASAAPHCPLCLNHPAPSTTCRMCGAEGEKFVIVGEEADGWSKPNEFTIADSGEVERLRAEVEWLRTHIREALVSAENGATLDALTQALREILE